MPNGTTVSGPAFVAAVQWVAKWVAAKPVVPVYGGIAIGLDDNAYLTLSASGENAAAAATIDAVDNDGPGGGDREPWRAVVSGRLLAELAGAMDKREITIEVEDGQVVLTSGKFVATLPAMDDGGQTMLPASLPVIGTIDGAAFAQAVDRVEAVAGRGMSPAFFNAVYLDLDHRGTAMLMTTDRNRVARVTLPWKAEGGIITTPDAAVLADAAKAFAGETEVTIGSDGSLLSFTSPTRSLSMTTVAVRDADGRLTWPIEVLSGQFDPDNPGCPARPHQVVLDRRDLTMPLKRARIMRGKEGPVRVTIRDGALALGAAVDTDGIKRRSEDAIEVDYSGPGWETGFNPDYLADALGTAPADVVRLHFGDPYKSNLLTCDTDPTWQHVLMPVRIR